MLLIGVGFFGVTASGSTRWISLFFINLQPSELMKVALIIFLARYYNRIPARDVNRLKFLIQPFFALFIPVALVITQPDLGTAILIVAGGLAVIWLAGLKIRYFIYSLFAFIMYLWHTFRAYDVLFALWLHMIYFQAYDLLMINLSGLWFTYDLPLGLWFTYDSLFGVWSTYELLFWLWNYLWITYFVWNKSWCSRMCN